VVKQTQRDAILLRYRFDDLAQMNNHLHVNNGRTLFFFREPRASLESGARVVIELSFANSEQVTTLRGSVIARVEGKGSAGAWLEFPDSRLAKRIDSRGAMALAHRAQRRLGCDLMVEMKWGAVASLGRMVDVSLTGARVLGATGVHLDNDVQLRVVGAQPPIPSDLCRAHVARADNGGDIGLRFLRDDSGSRVAASKLFQAVQASWSKALEIAHSPLCCKNGNILEPPMPHNRGPRA
jgi:hypothetical protein